MKISTRYFPFCQGVGWKIKGGKYIIPEINLDVWNKIIFDKNIIVVAYGGFIESYFSLCYLEMLNYIAPKNKIFWSGNSKFNSLISLNGIGKILDFPKKVLSKYPVPIFMDDDKNVYFNCLNNYLTVRPYYGGKGYSDKSPILKQLWRNSMTPWNNQYLPKFRRSNFPNTDFLQWSKITKFDLNRPYVCLIQNLNWSEHTYSSLHWSDTQIKGFAAMLRQKGISTLVISNDIGKFYGSSVHCIVPKSDLIIHAIANAKAILSEEADFILIAKILSGAKIITAPATRKLSLVSNGKFLNNVQDKNIFLSKRWTPQEVFNIIV